MLKKTMMLLASAAAMVSAPAMAATITFSQSGYGLGGILTGTFVGTSNTGTFDSDSLTSYNVRFQDSSGRNLTGGFLQDDFRYDISTNQIQFDISYDGSDSIADYRGGRGIVLNSTYSTSSSAAPTITFTPDPVTSAVPEPASWAMMLLGVGIAGASLRRRRVTTRVQFA